MVAEKESDMEDRVRNDQCCLRIHCTDSISCFDQLSSQ